MNCVLNKIFTEDITCLIIKYAKEAYDKDREKLYSLIYTEKPNKNYKIFRYKYNYKTHVDDLLKEVIKLIDNNLLDLNTQDKIYKYLVAIKIIDFIDIQYDDMYFVNTKNIHTTRYIFKLIGRENDSYFNNDITQLELYKKHKELCWNKKDQEAWIYGKSWIFW